MTRAVNTALAGAGGVLQVVYAYTGAAFVLTTTTLTEIIAATITPTSATSKILLLVTAASVGKSASNAEGWFGVYKNGSALLSPYDGIATYTGSTTTIGVGSVSCEYLDSPGTTSALTYSLRARDDQSSGLRINWEGGISSVTLLEIAA